MHAPARSARHVVLALLLLAALAPVAAAADRPTLDALEAAIRRVAAAATPKTVCVRIRLADGQEGFGSGAVVSADGLVLTCAHVTEPAKGGTLTAVFPDGTEAPLTVVASNAKNDYALLRLTTDRRDLPHFTFAPDEPALGDWVVGLGHPGGPYADHRPTVAAGKVTALDRRLPILMEGKAYVGAIQTDAPLFGGNSGGPLVDLDGRLVGINGAILMVGDGSFASSGVRIAKDLPALAAGHDVEGVEIDDLFGAMTAMAGEFDPEELVEAFADDRLREMFRAIGPMMRLAGRAEGAARRAAARRPPRERLAATGRVLPTSGDLLADGVVVGAVTFVGRHEGRALFLDERARRAVAGDAPDPFRRAARRRRPVVDGVARVRGIDGTLDLGLLDVASRGEDLAFPRVAADADLTPGSVVLLPVRSDGRPRVGRHRRRDRSLGRHRAAHPHDRHRADVPAAPHEPVPSVPRPAPDRRADRGRRVGLARRPAGRRARRRRRRALQPGRHVRRPGGGVARADRADAHGPRRPRAGDVRPAPATRAGPREGSPRRPGSDRRRPRR